MKTQEQKLAHWKEVLTRSETAYKLELESMDKREAIYSGDDKLRPVSEMDKPKDGSTPRTCHVYNIVAENIESEVDATIPKPKVTPRRKRDEPLARIIENMLRNELDRMQFEEFNDQMERTVPIQGGGLFLVEWDNSKRTQSTIGEVVVSILHPRKVLPQPGVYTGTDDMDYIIIRMPQTREHLERAYGVDLLGAVEQAPEVKGEKNSATDDGMLTQYLIYYKNAAGGVGLFSFVCDTVLEDLEDYQARRLRRCRRCGEVEDLLSTVLDAPTMDGTMPEGAQENRAKPGVCSYCGGREFVTEAEETEILMVPIGPEKAALFDETDLVAETDDDGVERLFVRAKVPCYKPDVFPVVLQKNVSVDGKFLGDSDVDKIRDQQNTINRLEHKIVQRIMRAGSVITLPTGVHTKTSRDEDSIWYLDSAKDKSMIDVYDFSGNLQYEMMQADRVYEQSRRLLGITDSFQGRKDPTATSGKAKEFAAAQSAGRMESKRVLKNAAYARLFELIFKFRLAYCDEPRSVVYKDASGETKYDTFNRADFLEVDEDGAWHWIDDFLFSTDTSAALAGNRAAMWQETTAQLQSGSYGNPTDIETLILYWTKMELLHYPGAGETKELLTQRLERQQQAQLQEMLQSQQPQPIPTPNAQTPDITPHPNHLVERGGISGGNRFPPEGAW